MGLIDIMKNASELELYIGALGAQVNSLRKNADETEESSVFFNKLVLKKAILSKQTEKNSQNTFFGRLRRKVLKQPKLICDYF